MIVATRIQSGKPYDSALTLTRAHPQSLKMLT